MRVRPSLRPRPAAGTVGTMTDVRTLIDPLGLWPRTTRLAGRAEHAALGTGERLLLAVVDRAVASGLPRQVVDRLLDDGLAEHIAERVLTDPGFEQRAAALLESPQTGHLLERVLDSEASERLVAQVLESRLVDVTVARVLASDELWTMVDEIARSPAVTEAITSQGAGFADQVADEVGARSRNADAWLERVAHRMLGRPLAAEAPPGTGLA